MQGVVGKVIWNHNVSLVGHEGGVFDRCTGVGRVYAGEGCGEWVWHGLILVYLHLFREVVCLFIFLYLFSP